MKTNKPYILLLLALTAVFTCCSGDDYSDINASGIPTGGSSTAPFTITVTDGGYASLSGGASTRASEAKYKTIFTEGDQIGVFAVKGSKIVNEVNNLCLTATNASDLTWKDAKGNPLADVKGATYYAYYPYKKDLKGEFTSVSQSYTAEQFFANVISNWSPKSDQSTYANYIAQDLMIAKGTMNPSVKSLSFSMKHQMALAVIDLPRIEYTFLNNNPSIPNYITDVPGAIFDEFKPCRMKDGMCRYLVKPSSQDALLSGSYTSAQGTVYWKVNMKNIAAGKYQIFEVDGGSSVHIKRMHELKIGDFFMKDGSLISGSESLTPAQQAACIGIVFWVGSKAFEEDPLLKSKCSDCTHGLVVALQDAGGTMIWSKNDELVQNWVKANNTYRGVNLSEINKMCGYSNTLALMAYNTAKGNSDYRVLPCDAILKYSTNNPAPTNSSDWYFPSVMELKFLCWGQGKNGGTVGRDYLNVQIGRAGVGSQINGNGGDIFYWSSSEHSSNIFYAWRVNFKYGSSYADWDKHYNYFHVRPFLAF